MVGIALASLEAINIPPVIRVYMNFRQPDQRGVVYPVPTAPNSNANSAGGNPAGHGVAVLVRAAPARLRYPALRCWL